MRYRVSVNDILWEINQGKPRRLMCDEFMKELYSHAVGVWNENVHQYQAKSIIARLAKLEAGGGQKRVRKVARNSSRRKKSL